MFDSPCAVYIYLSCLIMSLQDLGEITSGATALLLVFLCLGILQGRAGRKGYEGYSWVLGRSETLFPKHVSVTFDLSGDLCVVPVVRLALLNQIDVWQKNLTLQESALIYFSPSIVSLPSFLFRNVDQ